MRSRVAITLVGGLQLLLWAPYLFDPPWTLPVRIMVAGRPVWLDGIHFDLGRAVDFFPAVAMTFGAGLTIIIGFRPAISWRLMTWTIWINVTAILIVIVMNIIAGPAGALEWTSMDVFLIPTLLAWFGPPLLAIVLVAKRRCLTPGVLPKSVAIEEHTEK